MIIVEIDVFQLFSQSVTKPLDLITSWVTVFWTFITIFIFCELGEQVTMQFTLFKDEFCQCSWYLLSKKMQQMFIIGMTNVQQPTTVRGYGRALCSRIAFKQVHLEIQIHSSNSIKMFLFLDFKCRVFLFHDASSSRNVTFLSLTQSQVNFKDIQTIRFQAFYGIAMTKKL